MSEPQPIRPVRSPIRWWQYSLRSLLFLTFLAALVAKYFSGPEVLDEEGSQGAHRIVRRVIRDREGNPINHGLWTMYDAAGNTLAQGVYDHGQASGWWRYWHNEEPLAQVETQAARVHRRSMEGRYVRGQRDGRWTAWHPTGHRQWEIDYAQGKPVGAIRRWNPDGSPTAEAGSDAGGAQPRAVESAVETWRQALAGSDPQRRSEAGWALGRLHDSASADVLIEAMKNGEAAGSVNVRGAALIATRSRPDAARCLLQFEQGLADENLVVRLAAIDAVSQVGPAAAALLPKLAAPLPHRSTRPNDSKLRGGAVETDAESDLERCSRLAALSSIDSGRVSALEELLRSCIAGGWRSRDPSRPSLPSVIEVAPLRETPGTLESPAPPSYPRITRHHVAGLLRLLQHQEAMLRARAALAIDRLELPAAEAIAPLAALLDDAEPGVQLQACRSLARFGPAAVEAVPALQRLATGLDAELALAASATLYAINPPKGSPLVGSMHTGNSWSGPVGGPFSGSAFSGSAFGGFGGIGR